ncbi:MAG: methyltransferase domain-containing protein [Clostridia bacterium]|nr:methyltransferase domain-containing protein [Clostridia bacterium]
MYNDFALVYDRLTDNVEYRKRAEYFRSLLELCGTTDGLLLDAGCGTGRMTAEMLKYGFDVIGADNSAAMLNAARERVPGGLFVCQDLTRLDLYGTINGAFCCLDTLNHLSDTDELERALRRISLFTEPSGALVFDVNTVFKHRQILNNNTFAIDKGDVYCVWQNTLRNDGLTVDINLDFFIRAGGVYERFSDGFSERAFTDDELRSALERSGYRVIGVFDDMTMNEPDDRSERVYYCAVKSADS